MDNATIFAHVDHTLLRPTATFVQIDKLCKEALSYNMASVCVAPTYVARARKAYNALNICTVIGFPLGYDTTKAKAEATRIAILDGANEVDMVINLTDVKNGKLAAVTDEIALMREIAKDKILKVIIETCYLTNEEKILLCKCVTYGGADYIKTSTGFGTGGATLEDILLFKENIGTNVKIKASGGIRTREDMIAYLEAGCDRLGTSCAIEALT